MNYCWQGGNLRIEITVKLNYKGKKYQTNVIASKDTSEPQILQMAWEQVAK
ncbi:BA3454 family stress response protein [Neobacillus niacini]|uniref:BA3454 family stress response protein n=1 Tax=Neobacillus niacini TaxID=86668 RepID=UPI003B02934B